MRFWNQSKRRDKVKVSPSGITSPFAGYTRSMFSPTLNPEDVLEERSAPPSGLMDLNDAATGLSQDISLGGVDHRQVRRPFSLPSYSVTSVSASRSIDNTSNLAQTRQFCVGILRDMQQSLENIERRLRSLGV